MEKVTLKTLRSLATKALGRGAKVLVYRHPDGTCTLKAGAVAAKSSGFRPDIMVQVDHAQEVVARDQLAVLLRNIASGDEL